MTNPNNEETMRKELIPLTNGLGRKRRQHEKAENQEGSSHNHPESDDQAGKKIERDVPNNLPTFKKNAKSLSNEVKRNSRRKRSIDSQHYPKYPEQDS